jgi:hypothetical protein
VKRLWISSTAERSHYLRRLSLSDAIEEINHCSLPALCRFEPCRAYQRLELLAQAVDHPVDAVDLLDLSSPVALGRHKVCCWGRKPSFSRGSGKPLLFCFVRRLIDQHAQHLGIILIARLALSEHPKLSAQHLQRLNGGIPTENLF